MSAKMLRIALSEITTLRVVCEHCKRGVIEMKLEHLDRALDHGSCRLCNHEFFKPTAEHHLDALRLALENLAKVQDLTIELEIPQPG